ncbi:hypothetical protein Pcinc_025974 [Petrolisthes cinctipes]|uniref:C-type lectin domain-containing protein n=1 Tax=Petrolisthes cinctipes TaxID=88211 RepID=A0AAE1F6Y3_PETCI|nr:hypothetical protein Pcinc_025974 [Petrolisthes cinctipes]
MKCVLLLCLLGLAAYQVNGQRSFSFSSRPFKQSRPQFRPQFQPQQKPRPQFRPQHQFRPQPRPQFRPQQQFRPQPKPQFRPQQQFRPQSFTSLGKALSGGSGEVDGKHGNSEYHYSWLHDGDIKYTGDKAHHYCSSLGQGWYAVGVNDNSENSFINGVITSHNKKYIWTGGKRASGDLFTWLGGGDTRSYNNWSHTGGHNIPQPDNREDRNENCLAILNDFYQDGVKWHDIGCHHLKPVICERTA